MKRKLINRYRRWNMSPHFKMFLAVLGALCAHTALLYFLGGR